MCRVYAPLGVIAVFFTAFLTPDADKTDSAADEDVAFSAISPYHRSKGALPEIVYYGETVTPSKAWTGTTLTIPKGNGGLYFLAISCVREARPDRQAGTKGTAGNVYLGLFVDGKKLTQHAYARAASGSDFGNGGSFCTVVRLIAGQSVDTRGWCREGELWHLSNVVFSGCRVGD